MTISTESMVSVNVGSAANDGTGDDLRTAFIKLNNNFGNLEVTGFATGNISAAGSLEVTGNVTAGMFIGDGSLLTDVPSSYGNTQVEAFIDAYLPTYSGNLTSVGHVTPSSFQPLTAIEEGWFSANLGYTTNDTITQATDKSTGVTLDAPSGNIIMDSTALSNGANVGFTLTNSYIGSRDVLITNIGGGATAGAYQLQVEAVANGSANIRLYNVYGSSLSESVIINFAVIKVGQ